ncbi:hypothetical protein Anas_10170 [Armadillidium nasatum]|uniref:Uncharacterized protein n=1 Tax=Armadillidium nasatum TaxID=96803 RepID=A0A5N5SR61_9CRUS|nr:hypothetical protein Anas_10170 [Armadillidium nasatum]
MQISVCVLDDCSLGRILLKLFLALCAIGPRKIQKFRIRIHEYGINLKSLRILILQMKFSAEILLTVLMGSLLLLSTNLGSMWCVYHASTCERNLGCCCSYTKSCYIYVNSTVTNYIAAEALCNTFDRLSEACGHSISSLPTYFFAKGQGLLDCPHIHITTSEFALLIETRYFVSIEINFNFKVSEIQEVTLEYEVQRL